MTPPDSDAPKKRTPEEWRKLAEEERRGTEQGLAFLDAVERDGCVAHVKPDSDAREVEPDESGCLCRGGNAQPYCSYCTGMREREVYLPFSLAQRILAALEQGYGYDRLRALAAELRERMPSTDQRKGTK